MKRILLLSGAEKAAKTIAAILLEKWPDAQITKGRASESGTELQEYDLCLINTPLSDTLGDDVAVRAAKSGLCQVVLLVKAELHEKLRDRVEPAGVFPLPKPLDKGLLLGTLSQAAVTRRRMEVLFQENRELKRKIEDIRMVDRAKYVLMEMLQMSEKEAHRYIEKQAMDLRRTKREVATRIISTYQN